MVLKEEVLAWFKDLESYRRIDVLCGLLNMCLPFELRFAGTYVEELGKRDFQELRGAELRANNPDELAGEVGASGQPTGDPRAPRRMALYVSLLRSCNAACARTLHRVLLGLERAGLLRAEPLDELLLLYTMALHHPAFTFDQRSHFRDILERLEAEEPRAKQRQVAPPPPPPPQDACASCAPYVQQQLPPPPPPHPHPHPHPTSQLYMYLKPRIQVPPVSSDQVNEMVNTVVGTPNTPSSNDPMMPVLHEGVPAPSGYAVPQYNMVEYGISQGHWPEGGLIMQDIMTSEMFNFPSQQSPLISQPTSPSDSRPVSPNVHMPPPPLATNNRVAPRQTQDTALQLQQMTHDQHIHQQHQLTANFNNLNINEMRQMEDDRLHELGIPPNAVAQLRSIEKLNGMQRPPRTNKGPVSYRFSQNRHQQSSGSDSGSSTGGHSPPDTPALPAPAPLGPGRPQQPSSPLYLQQQTPYVQQHYPRSVFTSAFPSYRPNFTPFTTNGEAPIYGTQYNAPYVQIPMYSQPKVSSCFNCGSMGHVGIECKEPSIDEVTRAGGYQLDYSTAPPDINDK